MEDWEIISKEESFQELYTCNNEAFFDPFKGFERDLQVEKNSYGCGNILRALKNNSSYYYTGTLKEQWKNMTKMAMQILMKFFKDRGMDFKVIHDPDMENTLFLGYSKKKRVVLMTNKEIIFDCYKELYFP